MRSLHAKNLTNTIELSPGVKKLHNFVDGLPEPFKKSARYWLKKFAAQILENAVVAEEKQVRETVSQVSTTAIPENFSIDELFVMGREDVYASERSEWNKAIRALNHATINEFDRHKMVDWSATYANPNYFVVPISDGGVVIDRTTFKFYSKEYFTGNVAPVDVNEHFKAKLGDIFNHAA